MTVEPFAYIKWDEVHDAIRDYAFGRYGGSPDATAHLNLVEPPDFDPAEVLGPVTYLGPLMYRWLAAWNYFDVLRRSR